MRALWSEWLVHADAIVFVVDSADSARFEEAKRELDGLLADTFDDQVAPHEQLPVLVCASTV